VACEAVDTGPLPAPAGTLTVIDTPVAGLSSVTNAADAILGRNQETDSELRIRREEELRAAGKGTVDAIRALLLEVLNVVQAKVLQNHSGRPGRGGRAAHVHKRGGGGRPGGGWGGADFPGEARGLRALGGSRWTHPGHLVGGGKPGLHASNRLPAPHHKGGLH